MAFLVNESVIFSFCVALGIGLLVGAERERRKGSGISRAAAGVRTFAITAIAGAVSMQLGGGVMLAVVAFTIGMLAVVAYWRSKEEDPGMTTEISLILTCLLGGLATKAPGIAAGIGVALAALLAAKSRIHHFVRLVLTERELHDALLFAAAVLIVLPLSPDRFMGPFNAVNPYSIIRLVVLVMAVSALGYIAIRAFGVRYGLPLAGFAAGFISSTATIYLMGVRAKKNASHMHGAVAGATLSSIATIILMTIVIALVQPVLLEHLWLPMICGGLAASFYSLFFILKKLSAVDKLQDEDLGRAFNLKSSVIFAIIVTTILIISAAINTWMGSRGVLISAAFTGFVDAHATAISIASLTQANKLVVEQALWPILVGLTTNTVMKMVIAFKAGGIFYAARIVPGLVLMIGIIWLMVLI